MEECLHVSANFERNGVPDKIEFDIQSSQLNNMSSDYGLSNDGIRDFLDDNIVNIISNKLNIDNNCIKVGEFTFWFDWVEQTV